MFTVPHVQHIKETNLFIIVQVLSFSSHVTINRGYMMRTQEFINHQILQKELISHTVFIEDGWTSWLSKVKPVLMTRFITLQILFMLFTKHIGKCVISFIYNARDLHVQLNGLWMWFPHSRQKLLVWFFSKCKTNKAVTSWTFSFSLFTGRQGYWRIYHMNE